MHFDRGEIMSDLTKVIIFIFSMWILQGILSYFQIRNFKKVVGTMKKEGKLLIGQQKGRISQGIIVILAVDKDNKVVNAQEMRGITVFDRFKLKEEFINKSIDEIKKELPSLKDKKTAMALKKAFD